MTCRSLEGILVLYAQDTSRSYNPKVQKVSVIIEDKPNQLYAQEVRLFEQNDEICKYFAKGKHRDKNATSKTSTE